MRGKRHKFLRMDITIIEYNNIKIEMMTQVKDTITSFGEIVSGTVSSPSAQHLITVNEEAENN